MIWIFCLAGIFASSAKAMGAVDATVALTLKAVPSNFLPAGIFIAACFISMAIGTSVGTIVALAPVVTAMSQQIGCDTAWLVAIVVGGAFFGDNLSFISDTTIAATQSQGCKMSDKFKTNFKIVIPAALATLCLYIFGNQTAVHLIVRPSNVCNSGNGGAGYVKAERNLFLCNQGRHFHTRILSYNNTSSVISTLTLLSRKLTLRRVSIYCHMAKSSLSNVCSFYMLLHCMSYIICFVPTCHF